MKLSRKHPLGRLHKFLQLNTHQVYQQKIQFRVLALQELPSLHLMAHYQNIPKLNHLFFDRLAIRFLYAYLGNCDQKSIQDFVGYLYFCHLNLLRKKDHFVINKKSLMLYLMKAKSVPLSIFQVAVSIFHLEDQNCLYRPLKLAKNDWHFLFLKNNQTNL